LNLDNLLATIKAEYALSWDGIHGIAHWTRVRENGLRLAERTGAQTAVVECFAYLHDAKRLNDGGDPRHGARGAALARRLCAGAPDRAGERGDLLGLSDAQLELLVYACTHHTDGLTEANVTIQTCWDADRLDLGRVGIRPRPERLCTPAAREPAILEWAWERSRAGQVWTLDHDH
jgi:uncharacterized protein